MALCTNSSFKCPGESRYEWGTQSLMKVSFSFGKHQSLLLKMNQVIFSMGVEGKQSKFIQHIYQFTNLTGPITFPELQATNTPLTLCMLTKNKGLFAFIFLLWARNIWIYSSNFQDHQHTHTGAGNVDLSHRGLSSSPLLSIRMNQNTESDSNFLNMCL